MFHVSLFLHFHKTKITKKVSKPLLLLSSNRNLFYTIIRQLIYKLYQFHPHHVCSFNPPSPILSYLSSPLFYSLFLWSFLTIISPAKQNNSLITTKLSVFLLWLPTTPLQRLPLPPLPPMTKSLYNRSFKVIM